MDNQCLWSPPEQAGWLKKQSHSRSPKWIDRFFVLKGSFLFYFKNRKSVTKLHGVIPLENAKVETEIPATLKASSKSTSTTNQQQYIITVTLHTQHAYSCRHAFYVLQAPTSEVQSAWVNALWQAAIPRSELVLQLSSAGRLANLVASYAQQLQQCFPTADASVLSTSGKVRISGTIGNIGGLAAVLRKAKANKASQDVNKLPTLPASAAQGTTTVLARTASGSVIPAAAAEWAAPGPQLQLTKDKTPSNADITVATGAALGAQQPAVDVKETTIAAVTTTTLTTAPAGSNGGRKSIRATSVADEMGLRGKVAQQARQSAALTLALSAAQAQELSSTNDINLEDEDEGNGTNEKRVIAKEIYSV